MCYKFKTLLICICNSLFLLLIFILTTARSKQRRTSFFFFFFFFFNKKKEKNYISHLQYDLHMAPICYCVLSTLLKIKELIEEENLYYCFCNMKWNTCLINYCVKQIWTKLINGPTIRLSIWFLDFPIQDVQKKMCRQQQPRTKTRNISHGSLAGCMHMHYALCMWISFELLGL